MELLALLVFIASIITFFSGEFGRLFRKIYSIPGAPVVLPLLIISGFLVAYMQNVLSFLLWNQSGLRFTMIKLVECLPFHTGAAFITEVICLFLFTTIPVWGLYWSMRSQIQYLKKAKPYATHVYAVLWIYLVILWIA